MIHIIQNYCLDTSVVLLWKWYILSRIGVVHINSIICLGLKTSSDLNFQESLVFDLEQVLSGSTIIVIVQVTQRMQGNEKKIFHKPDK